MLDHMVSSSSQTKFNDCEMHAKQCWYECFIPYPQPQTKVTESSQLWPKFFLQCNSEYV